MSTFLLTLHVVAAVLFMGVVMYSTSAFAPAAMRAAQGEEAARGSAHTLHRASKLYGTASVIVPVLGFTVMLMGWDYFKTQGQLHAALLLSLIAWAILLAVVLPRQRALLAAVGAPIAGDAETVDGSASELPSKIKKQLSIFSGIFNLLWVIVLVLMFV